MQPSVFDSLFLNAPSILFFDVIINIFLAFLFGLAISTIYRITYKGYSYSSSFVNTLIIITLVTAVVIMVIGNNLARAFGLVGAMSIIRFRTVLKDTRDIAFVFFALAAGMAAGAGNHAIGIAGATAICLVILGLFWTNYGMLGRRELLLKFWMIPEEGEEPVYAPVFKKFLARHSLLNVQSARLGQFLELRFYVTFKKEEESRAFIRELSGLEGIEKASLIIGEETENI